MPARAAGVSSMGETIGTIQQDRATAIAGTLGSGPRLIPMRVSLERSNDPSGSARRSFTYQVVDDQLFTPLLAYVAMFNTLASYERQFGATTFAVKSRARITGHADLAVEDVFTGDTPLLGASTAVAGPLSVLLTNDIEPIKLEGLDVQIVSSEAPRSISIERVWLDDIRPRAGRTLPLKILTRSYRGDETISTLREIKEMGVRLSVDDFGTGYSSLTYLSRFPIDELKIDRTFVRGLPGERQNAAIVGAILVLGHELGMNVVAEGVETKEQLQFLAQRRCNEFQGYLCSRPAPAEQFAQLVRRSLPQAA